MPEFLLVKSTSGFKLFLTLIHSVTIRPSTANDFDFLISLRENPEVRKNQFPVTDESKKTLRLQLEKSHEEEISHYTIEMASEPCGHITYSQPDGLIKDSVGRECEFYYVGFDLLPEYWGKGIMAKSLLLSFDKLFANDELIYICAECDGGNRRCQRMLEKVGFYRTPISLWDRIQWWRSCKRYTWFARYMYSSESWLNP